MTENQDTTSDAAVAVPPTPDGDKTDREPQAHLSADERIARLDAFRETESVADAQRLLKAVGFDVTYDALQRWAVRNGVMPGRRSLKRIGLGDSMLDRLKLAEDSMARILDIVRGVKDSPTSVAIAIGEIGQVALAYGESFVDITGRKIPSRNARLFQDHQEAAN